MPFTIIISEKGGAERRETYDKTEINVGRVQGNDLMLPKGNVSKHHARLLYRDGRFIVTDLKSTNGTYVNGRKITQATIVREGDKIYIGDFVLRLDLGGAPASQNDEQPTAVPDQQQMPPGMPPLPQPPAMGAPPPPPMMQPPMAPVMSPAPPPPMMPPPAPMMSPGPPPAMPMPPTPPPIAPMGPPPGRTLQPAAPPPNAGGVSHYPLERDPDDSDMAASPQVPAPPRVPAQQRPLGGTLSMGSPAPAQQPSQQPPPVARPSAHPPQPSSPQIAVRPVSTPSRLPPKETPQQAGRRLALVTLVDRVADVVSISSLRGTVEQSLVEKVQRAAREQADAMREEGEAPEGVDLDVLVKDAVRELTGFGAIGPLLEEDDVSEIHVLRHDQVVCVRAGQLALADGAYTQDEAVGRAIERLALSTGEPLADGERIVERRLPKGAHMLAFVPPASSTHAVVIRKRRKVEMSLEDYVRLTAMSRQMASFLEQCLAARANILVVAQGAVHGAGFVGALANTGTAGDRIALLLDNEDLNISHAHVVALALGPDPGRDRALRGAAKMRPDRMVIGCLSGSLVAATMESIAEGQEGVIACASAPSLRHALARLVGQLTMSRPGVPLESSREIIGESFDIAVELSTLPDGRYRITRIAELAGSDAKGVVARDIFTAPPDAPDAGHVATGVVPRVASDFAARGVRMDPNLFKKGR